MVWAWGTSVLPIDLTPMHLLEAYADFALWSGAGADKQWRVLDLQLRLSAQYLLMAPST